MDAAKTLQQFGYRRLRKGFTDVFLDAMVGGICATTPDSISVGAAFSLAKALEREPGGLFRGMLAKRRKPTRRVTVWSCRTIIRSHRYRS